MPWVPGDSQALSNSTVYLDSMAEATPPTLAARNAYALVLVVLMLIFVSQAGGVIDRNVYIEVLFYLAASSYLVSWYYYNWKQDDESPDQADPEENSD